MTKSSWLASYWRDPDPVRRWSAGQFVRHWWQLPLAWPAIGMVLIAVLPFAFLYFLSSNPNKSIWHDLDIVAPIMFLTLLVALVFGEISVALSPAHRLERLGGPPVLRDLWLALPGPKAVSRLLYAGSWRGSAAPWLALLYVVEIVALVMWTLASALNGDPSPIKFVVSERFASALLAFILVPLPALDFAMNLALAWRIRLRTGKPYITQGLMLAIALVGPVFAGLLFLATELSPTNPFFAMIAAVLIVGLLAGWAFVEFYRRPRLYWLAPVAVLLILFVGYPAIFHLLAGYGLFQPLPFSAAFSVNASTPVHPVLCAWLALITPFAFKMRCAFGAWRGLGKDFERWLEN